MLKNNDIIFVLTVMLITVGCDEASSSGESESEPPIESSTSQIESSSSEEESNLEEVPNSFGQIKLTKRLEETKKEK